MLCLTGGGASVKAVDGISLNVPHGVFLVKKPKLASPSESDKPIITTGLQHSRNVYFYRI